METGQVDWHINDLVEIELFNPDDFLLVKETLTRIGIASFKNKILWQSCHILYKRNKYYIVSFKEMFCLDGRTPNFSIEDRDRRNSIINLLVDWGLCKLIMPLPKTKYNKFPHLTVIKFTDKDNWKLESKYTIGQ